MFKRNKKLLHIYWAYGYDTLQKWSKVLFNGLIGK
jgi:hypothetical protein